MITIHVNPITGEAAVQDPHNPEVAHVISGANAGAMFHVEQGGAELSVQVGAATCGRRTEVIIDILRGTVEGVPHLGPMRRFGTEPGVTPIEEAAADDPFIACPECDRSGGDPHLIDADNVPAPCQHCGGQGTVPNPRYR